MGDEFTSETGNPDRKYKVTFQNKDQNFFIVTAPNARTALEQAAVKAKAMGLEYGASEAAPYIPD